MASENTAPNGVQAAVGPGEASAVFQLLRDAFPAASLTAGEFRGQSWVIVPADLLSAVCLLLRDDSRCDFKLLLDVTAVDLLPASPRWEVVYHLLSISRNDRCRIKVEVPDGESPAVPTVTGLWPSAAFYEREIFDLMGIAFDGHVDLRRLLLPDDWVGHPLRFDHPLGGEEVSFTS